MFIDYISSGYDFGYLLKMLTGKLLPDTESDFFELLKIFFPTIYDVKYLMKSCKNLKGGLEEVAKQLEVNVLFDLYTIKYLSCSLLPYYRLSVLVHSIKLVVIVS